MKEENAGRKCIRVSLGQQYVKVKAYTACIGLGEGRNWLSTVKCLQ